MMIHTTQNLNSLVHLNQLSSNNVSSKDFRLKNYSEQMLMPKISAEGAGIHNSSISFEGKKPTKKNVEILMKNVKKGVGEIKNNPNPEKKGGDGILISSIFNKSLDVTDYETVATALVAAGACAARGGTILAIPTKKNKEDNMYAAGHAWASGAVGFLTAFILTAPFKAGSNYVMRELKQQLSEKTLKRLWPQIDLKSINNADGTRKSIKEWLDVKGNAFVDDMKGCETLPKLTNLANSSVKTFEKLLGVKIDWASQSGKSFNDVVTKDGKKFYDVVDMSRLGILVMDSEVGKKGQVGQILLKDIDSSYLEQLIKNSDNNWAKLDINSVYKNKGTEKEIVNDFRLWKDNKGKQWKLDLDEVGISSPYETFDYMPRISGKKRFNKKDREYKFYSYQKNGKDGRLGTPIDNKMVEADAANDGLFKLLTWGPDLMFRIPVAAGTIALIPWVLKHAFGLEKSSSKKKKAAQLKEAQVQQDAVKKDDIKIEDKNQTVVFKGKNPNPDKAKGFFEKLLETFAKRFGELYGKPLIENETVHNISKWLSKLPGTVTQHMTVLGSLITSSVYMEQTLTNKDLDPDRRRTLAINQGLCFLVPTFMAYLVDTVINEWVKRKGYRFTGLKQHDIDIDKIEKKSAEVIEDETRTLSKKTKGIRTLASITVFALIYRYLTPVLMTPVANKIGDTFNEKRAERRRQKALEIEMNMKKDLEQTKQIA